MATSVSRTLLAASLLFSTSFANAGETPPPAYQLIALPAGVPSEVLYSIALQESGTRLRGRLVPWPWTLNVAGNGYRFANRSDACGALLHALRTAGSHRVDVGLGQTNLGANGHRYNSPCEGLDPHKNLAVTARILAEHKSKGGDWITAAGRYHRPAGGEPAARYRRAFTKHLNRVIGTTPMVNNP